MRETAQAREWAGFPSTAVPIGSNGSGDYLVCMPMLGDETKLAEAVYVWDHETRQLSPVVVEWSEGGISL